MLQHIRQPVDYETRNGWQARRPLLTAPEPRRSHSSYVGSQNVGHRAVAHEEAIGEFDS